MNGIGGGGGGDVCRLKKERNLCLCLVIGDLDSEKGDFEFV